MCFRPSGSIHESVPGVAGKSNKPVAQVCEECGAELDNSIKDFDADQAKLDANIKAPAASGAPVPPAAPGAPKPSRRSGCPQAVCGTVTPNLEEMTMAETLLNKYGIKQIGFYVESIERVGPAVPRFARHRALCGSGSLRARESLTYRGAPSGMRSRCALGHFGRYADRAHRGAHRRARCVQGARPFRPTSSVRSALTTLMPWQRNSPRPASRSPWI